MKSETLINDVGDLVGSSNSYRVIRGLPVSGEDPGALGPGEQEVLARVDRRVGRVVGAQLHVKKPNIVILNQFVNYTFQLTMR